MISNADQKCRTVELLVRLGLDADSAAKLAEILPVLIKIFPLPDPKLRSEIGLMVAKIWDQNVSTNLRERKDNIKAELDSIFIDIADHIGSSDVFALMSYLKFAKGWDPIRLLRYGIGAKYAVDPKDADVARRKKLKKLHELLLSKYTSYELNALESHMIVIADAFLANLDARTHNDQSLTAIKEGVKELDMEMPPPSGQVFSWMYNDPHIELSFSELFDLPGTSEGANKPVLNRQTTASVFKVVRVYFSTDRERLLYRNVVFGQTTEKIRYGFCDVSIPHTHSIGELESPSIFRFEIRESPKKHVVVVDTQLTSRSEFFQAFKEDRRYGNRRAFVFVHGYRVSFVDAARRAAQIAYDLDFDGIPFFYSWPSLETVLGYPVDEQTMEWSQKYISEFVRDVVCEGNFDSVYLIAHSMGARGATRAIIDLQATPKMELNVLKEVILAAPDIDAAVFKRDIAPKILLHNYAITLYASSKDLALKASHKVHGYSRAGDTSDGICILPPIETIDASNAHTDLIGHSYVSHSRSIISDIFYILRYGKRAKERYGLEMAHSNGGPYWVLKA